MANDACTHLSFKSTHGGNLVVLVFSDDSYNEACARIIGEEIPNCPGGGRNAFVVPREKVKFFQGLTFETLSISRARCGEC